MGLQYRDYSGAYKSSIPTSLVKPERIQKRADIRGFVYHIDYLDIPLQFQYHLNNAGPDFDFYCALGFQFSKLLDYEAEYKFIDGDAFIHNVNLLNSSWGIKGATVSIGTAYNIHPSFSMYMEEAYRRQLSSQGLKGEKNHSAGITLGLNFRIK
ncbi:MAG: hypothetical protein ACJA01_004052 [Saprospiraceae bacterium]|jgi:hypothetical protein